MPASPTSTSTVALDPQYGLNVARIERCVVRWADQDAATPLSLDDDLYLVDATGRILRAGKRGTIDPRLAPILSRLGLRVEDWLATMLGWRQMHGTALGAAATQAAEAARRGLRWIKNRCTPFAARSAAGRFA